MFEFLTGDALFQVSSWGEPPLAQIDDDHLLQMIDGLGQLPSEMFAQWPRRNRYFGPELEVIRTDVGPAEVSDAEIYNGPTLEQMLQEQKPQSMPDHEVEQVLSILRRLLQYEAGLRPSTKELLEDEWFRNIVVGV